MSKFDSLMIHQKLSRFSKRAIYWMLFWLLAIGLCGGADLFQYVAEQRHLAGILRELNLKEQSTEQKALAIQGVVRSRTSTKRKGRFYDVANRPRFRHTAFETWQMAEGQCGEGARLMVNLLQASGVPASRVNLSSSTSSFCHTAVAYFDSGEWWFLDSINSPEDFYRWSRENRKSLPSLLSVRMDPGGALLVKPQNEYFDRYSYAPWARLLGSRAEINQFTPFPQWIGHILENPPLFVFGAKAATSAALTMVAVLCIGLLDLLRRRKTQGLEHITKASGA